MKYVKTFESFLNESLSEDGIRKYYSEVCKSEGIEEIPIKFGRVAYGGAATTYDTVSMKPLYITFDISKMRDAEYAILHEITHQMKLVKEKDAYLGKRDQTSKFKKLENYLIDKYMYSNTSKLLWQ